jgi:hypothetical protein
VCTHAILHRLRDEIRAKGTSYSQTWREFVPSDLGGPR